MKTAKRNGIISSNCLLGYIIVRLNKIPFFAILTLLVWLPFFSNSQDNSSFGFNTVSPDVKENVMATLRKSHNKFQVISNDGQMGLPDNVIAYFSTDAQIIFIEKDRLRVIVLEGKNTKRQESLSFSAEKKFNLLPDKYRYNSFSIKFKSSNAFSRFEKGKEFETRRNFINTQSSQAGVTNVLSYEEITLKDVYKGIDLRLYSQETGHLEFDWIVWPGADPDKIRMQFEGQKKISIGSDGNLEINLEMGVFNMHMPESYYSTPMGKINAEFKFRLAGKNEVSFIQNKKHKDQYPLVIDPDLLWGTFMDGANANFDEYLYAIEYDYSNQKLYCAGVANRTISTAYISALSSGYNGTFSAGKDVIIYALSKNGQFINYCTYYGGSSDDVATGISIYGTNVFVCGFTSSSDFPVTNGSGGTTTAFDNSLGGNQDGFVIVLNEALSQITYSTYLGGTSATSNDAALTIRAVSSNSFYVSLHIESSLPTSSPNYLVSYADNSFGGTEEAWIAKFTSFNTLRFGTYVGGTDIDVVNDFQILSDGDVVFTGTTNQINQINGTVSDNSTGSDVLFGRIDVPASGSVSFSILEKIGGNGTDNGYGLLALGDSISIIVGQTNSVNFPMGGGTPFQSFGAGDYDGFVARINNDGTGGYKASFVGGSDVDILVSVRPIIMNSSALLLCFGSTKSTNLAVTNFNSGTLYSGTNSGGLDMMFLVCDLNLSTKYYLSYIGGSGNDYLGATGVPFGSNHLYYNSVDSILYLGTTTHSNQSTHHPLFVGRGIADAANSGVAVFDETKGNGTNDTHVILAISAKVLYTLLDVKWQSYNVAINNDCSIELQWEVTDEGMVSGYEIERSLDGKNFVTIGSVQKGSQQYAYKDRSTSGINGNVFYRIRALNKNGYCSFSKTLPIRLCDLQTSGIKAYPTIARDHITIDGFNFNSPKNIIIQMYNSRGSLVTEKRMTISNGPIVFPFKNISSTGSYYLMIKDPETGGLLQRQKIIVVSY